MNFDHVYAASPRRRRRPLRPRPEKLLAKQDVQPRADALSPDVDINISNGTCYAGPNARLNGGFLACGNAAIANQTCCWAGDTCLEDRACFGVHDGDYVTYLAGCTDATYADAGACPDKRGSVADEVQHADRPVVALPPWVGLAYCNGTSEQWVVCPQPNAPTTLQSAAPCACPTPTTARTVALVAGSTLAGTASLPTVSGGNIAWVAPYTPTISATTASVGASTTTAAHSPQSTDAYPFPTDNGAASANSPALLVGVSVGVGGFLLLILLGGIALGVRRRQRMRQAEEARRLDSNSSSNGSSLDRGTSSSWWPWQGRPTQTAGGMNKGKARTTQSTEHEAPYEKGNDHPFVDGEDNDMGRGHVITGSATAVTLTPAMPVLSELEPRPARPWSMRSELEGSSVLGGAGAVSPMMTARARSSIGTILTSGWLDSVREEEDRGQGRGDGGPAGGPAGRPAGNTAPDMQVLAELEA